MRVVTWNIEHAHRHDADRSDVDALVQACVALGADVLALQEVDRRTSRVGGVDLLAVVADATGLVPLDGHAFARDDWTYGNALLVRGEPRDVQRHVLPESRRPVEARTIVSCRLDGLAVACCHLDHRGEAAVQLGAALALLADSGPAVLAGDLNLRPEAVDAVLAAVDPRWRRVEVPPAFPARAPDRVIDHVLVRDVEVASVGPPADRPAVSDHRPVTVELRV